MNDMETKFTKGEWSIGVDCWADGHVSIDGFEHSAIAVVVSEMDDGSKKEELSANAYLIARAPNLYHALKRTNEELALLIDLYNKKIKDPAHFIDAETCRLNNIELAKARGE